MAKDGFDLVNDVIGLVKIPSILALLGTGCRVDASFKTTGSDKKGIVVSSIGITNVADQIGIGNVNCYVPAISLTVNNKATLLPDHPALTTLAKAIAPLIDEQYHPTFRCWVLENATIMQDNDGSYFANIRFRYQSIQ